MSVNPTQTGQPQSHQQQAKTASRTSLSLQKPSAPGTQASQACPGTNQTKFDCNTLTAIATVRQANAADAFNTVAYVEIGIGLFTAVAAFFAALFAARAAKAARDTVKAFVEVEVANIVMTLDNFGEKPIGVKNETTGGLRVLDNYLTFDVIANNIGRSSALITQVSHAWYKTAELERDAIMTGPPKTYIVKAGDSTVVRLGTLKPLDDLRETRFLWLLVSYKAPLCPDEQVLRVCFEVFGLNSNIAYKEAHSEHWNKGELQRAAPPKPWWRKPWRGLRF